MLVVGNGRYRLLCVYYYSYVPNPAYKQLVALGADVGDEPSSYPHFTADVRVSDAGEHCSVFYYDDQLDKAEPRQTWKFQEKAPGQLVTPDYVSPAVSHLFYMRV